jgi:hypothetical protein
MPDVPLIKRVAMVSCSAASLIVPSAGIALFTGVAAWPSVLLSASIGDVSKDVSNSVATKRGKKGYIPLFIMLAPTQKYFRSRLLYFFIALDYKLVG